MPIRIPDSLPATGVLEGENIFVMTERRALHQDIRPLNLLILNLMPTKIVTETQLLRKLSNTPLQVNVQLLQTRSHTSQNTDTAHLQSFYTTFDQVREQQFDGMIITGAPVENLEFEEVDYWDELCKIMDWTRTHLPYLLGRPGGALPPLRRVQAHPAPQAVRRLRPHHHPQALPPVPGLRRPFLGPPLPLHRDHHGAASGKAGAGDPGPVPRGGVKSSDNRRFFIFAHPEYDGDTLAQEYFRDVKRGLDPDLPAHYFPGDNPSMSPIVNWRSSGQLLYTNWLNYYVYQATPYEW